MNFLRLQLQNDSALGVEVNPEAYLCTLLQTLKKFGCLTSAMITTAESKLKHYMHNGLSVYHNKYCKTTFLAYPT